MSTPFTSTPLPAELRLHELKQRGWTDLMIRQFLGEPDSRESPSGPRGGRPASLYSTQRVLAAERTERFLRALTASRSRSHAVRAVLDDKRDNLTRISERISISGPTLSADEVLAAATIELQSESSTPSLDAVLSRAVSIALTHLTVDDALLDVYHWHAGVRAARAALEKRKLDVVALHYPVLAPTCRHLSEDGRFEHEEMAG